MAVLCAGSPVISADYCYFSFYDAFYKVWQLLVLIFLRKITIAFTVSFFLKKNLFFQFFRCIFKLKLRAVF